MLIMKEKSMFTAMSILILLKGFGLWALVKRAYYGQHYHYTKKYTELYIAEAFFKYNHRKENQLEVFASILGGLLYV